MSYQRRILHHGSGPAGTPTLLADRAIKGCWFELHRQGGCGAGELELADAFVAAHDIDPGDWISFEYAPGNRWYLGRVEEIRSTLPAGRRLRLEGMCAELAEIFPGGFGESADGAKPHRYAATDLFSHDPDRDLETADSAASVLDVLQLVLNQYVSGHSHIDIENGLIESPLAPAEVTSLKFHGEESVRSIIKDLATRAQGASWGVNAQGKFFFLRPRTTLTATYRCGREIRSLVQTRQRENVFNRILLTGDYVYDRRDYSGVIARRSYRWRATFVQPESRALHGDRRIRLWVPWVRTQQDARAFSREFFRTYAMAKSTYVVETLPTANLPLPWLGQVLLEDASGIEIDRAQVETVRVSFDAAPVLKVELGPIDPRDLWPEPPHDERWELPDEHLNVGGNVSNPDDEGGGGANSTSANAPPPTSDNVSSFFSVGSSAATSQAESQGSSLDSSAASSIATSAAVSTNSSAIESLATSSQFGSLVTDSSDVPFSSADSSLYPSEASSLSSQFSDGASSSLLSDGESEDSYSSEGGGTIAGGSASLEPTGSSLEGSFGSNTSYDSGMTTLPGGTSSDFPGTDSDFGSSGYNSSSANGTSSGYPISESGGGTDSTSSFP